MDETKFAELDHEQIKDIKRLEEKLDVTLIAYDLLAINEHTQHNNTPINPS